jgi:hypothetical protein
MVARKIIARNLGEKHVLGTATPLGAAPDRLGTPVRETKPHSPSTDERSAKPVGGAPSPGQTGGDGQKP